MTMNPVYPHHQGPQAKKRTSWVVCNWDPEQYQDFDVDSDYDEDECYQSSTSQDTIDESQLEKRIGGEHSDDTESSKASSSASAAFPMAPRPGSLLQLILQEDSPTISGCERPPMRRRGSMEEKIPPKHDELFSKMGGFRFEDSALDRAISII